MQTLIWNGLTEQQKQAALQRPLAMNDVHVQHTVRQIIEDVKLRGEQAVIDYTAQFDGVTLTKLTVDPVQMQAAWTALPEADKQALQIAKTNIEQFHRAQTPQPIEVETMPGVICRREVRPLETVGLYVPGGTAPLVSTLLMLAVPAQIAGVKRRIIVTPPAGSGQINQAILAAAHLCQVTEMFTCGGAQAIAAMAFGTTNIPRCDKIFGPGNLYVTTAKQYVAQLLNGPAIDLPAGPSEVMVVAGANANPSFVAADLLSQAEHDVLAQVMCICPSTEVANAIITQIGQQITSLPRRKIAEQALSSARFIIADTRSMIVDIINTYAPEHLLLQIDDPELLVPDIQHAGSIFLGNWTPEAVGDYASGTNHTLPTSGAARAYSGVTVESFMKYISIQQLSRLGLQNIAPTVERLAQIEGLEAHRRAVGIRLEGIN